MLRFKLSVGWPGGDACLSARLVCSRGECLIALTWKCAAPFPDLRDASGCVASETTIALRRLSTTTAGAAGFVEPAAMRMIGKCLLCCSGEANLLDNRLAFFDGGWMSALKTRAGLASVEDFLIIGGASVD